MTLYEIDEEVEHLLWQDERRDIKGNLLEAINQGVLVPVGEPVYRNGSECTSLTRLGSHFPNPMIAQPGDKCEDCGAEVKWVVEIGGDE